MSQAKRAPWYKDAVFYELRVGTFFDSNGDGVGDFRGLMQKLDYLQELGVDTLWLLPFYPSPGRDDGYDISDYVNVHPDNGTLADFRAFLREAHRRGLRVVTELVLNHTSDQHAWFQRSRSAGPGSRERDFYVWSDTVHRYGDARIIFKDFESSNWTWDNAAKAHYWHRFYSHQPDLNYDNPAVRKAMLGVLDFWLGMGVDGLRLDAVPYLFERDGTSCENLPETHAFLKEVRRHVEQRYGDRMLLAEANQWAEDAAAYFGAGDECHMAFHFPVMPRLFQAAQLEDRFPIVDTLRHLPAIPEGCQWAVFLRNHDELSLEMVTDEEREYMYRAYAPNPRARVNVGIRRRLAPLLGNNRRKIELLNAMLLSLPGAPVLYYGDEIGMGDNIYLPDRNGVRTPMQWSADRNAGFSRGSSQRIPLPVISESEYHYETVNVEAQHNNPSSLLWWMRRLIALRRRHPAFGSGSVELLHPRNPRVLAFLRCVGDEKVLVVFNLSRYVQFVELDLEAHAGLTPVELFGRTVFPAVGRQPYLLTLGPNSFYWFSLEARRPEAALAAAEAPPPEVPLETPRSSPFEGRALRPTEAAVAAYLRREAPRTRKAALTDAADLPGAPGLYLTVWRLEYEDRPPEDVFLALGCAFQEEAERLRQAEPARAVAVLHAARPAASGLLYDAAAEPRLAAALYELARGRRALKTRTGELGGVPTPDLKRLLPSGRELAPSREARAGGAIVLGGNVVTRVRRALPEGSDPELEVLRALCACAAPSPAPALAGWVELRRERAPAVAVALLPELVPHEGAAWTRAKDALRAYLENSLAESGEEAARAQAAAPDPLAAGPGASVPEAVARRVGPFIESARLLGRRAGELHRALAACAPESEFKPEPFSTLYQRSLYQTCRNAANRAFEAAREAAPAEEKAGRPALARLLASEARLDKALRQLLGARLSGSRIRVHGSLHLGHALFTGRDFMFVGFDEAPGSASERRLKRSPLRDMASLLRSVHRVCHAARVDLVSRGAATPDAAALDAWLAAWRRGVSTAVMSGYLEAMEGSELIPKPDGERRALLTALMLGTGLADLERALRESAESADEPARFLLETLG